MVPLTYNEFKDLIELSFNTMKDQLEAYRCIATLQFAFGLRLAEASEINRWNIYFVNTNRIIDIQLAKGEGLISHRINGLRFDIVEFFYNVGSFPDYYSRFGYLNRVKKSLPRLITNGDSHKILTHSYRYLKFKELHEAGFTIAQIAVKMGHMSEGSTYQYVFDPVYLLT